MLSKEIRGCLQHLLEFSIVIEEFRDAAQKLATMGQDHFVDFIFHFALVQGLDAVEADAAVQHEIAFGHRVGQWPLQS